MALRSGFLTASVLFGDNMRHVAFSIIIGALIVGALPASVLAQASPDDLIILSVQGYTDLLETDDLLLVVHYDIEYASPPTQLVSDTFIARFLRDTTDLNSTELFPFNERGYNEGIFSFYWTATQRSTDSVEYNNTNSENYLVRLQGKVGVFPGGVPSVTTSAITWRATGDLKQDIIDLALALDGDADWTDANDLIVTGDQTQFTTKGEEYFATVIPRLSSMVPSLFESAVTVLLPVTRTPQNTYKKDLDNFWVGTPIVDTNLQRIADNFQVDLVVVKTFLGFLFMLVAGFLAAWLVKDQGGRAAEFGMLAMALVFVLEIPVGIVTMPLGMIVGLLALVGLSWAFFGRRGG